MLVECVPNFSEGRDPARIEALAAAAGSVPGAALLDLHRDPDHNRCVLTLVGEPQAVAEAAFRAVAVAVAQLDLRTHQGVHPRIGVADVIPFVPLRGASLGECAELARVLGRRLADELALPVYLYGAAATRPERASLPWLRQPQFEGLGAALASEERAPDFGPRQPHPSAGASAVGARELLLAFNVDLETQDLRLARRIARALRTSSGGLPGVQAKGLPLAAQGRVQVSTNLFSLGETGPARVYAEVARLAAAAGVEVAGSELVGLLPEQALLEAAQVGLGLRQDLGPCVLERRIAALGDPAGPLPAFLSALASPEPDAPGGGSAAAVTLALGEACLAKALALSGDRGSGEQGSGEKGSLDARERAALASALAGEARLSALAREDHAAFAGLMALWKSPKGTPGRKQALAAARAEAVRVPVQILAQAERLAAAAAEVAERGNPNLVNDAAAAAEFAAAAARIARLNARANQTRAALSDLAEPLARIDAALARARAAAER